MKILMLVLKAKQKNQAKKPRRITMSFNAHTIKLQGRHLIEASAGTGKTYSIANLFLRFLVEPHPVNANLPLTVDQILVVTFTNAAADELRARIRAKVESALIYMQTGESLDNFIKEFLSQFTDDPQKICYSLYQALLCIDEAAIYTIHSFAVRTVKMFMFETGAYADIKVAIGGDADKERLIKNLWRELQWLNLGEKPAVFTDFSSFYGYFSKQHQAEIKPQLVANTLDDLLNSNMAWQQNEALGWANYVKAFLLTLLNNRLAHYEKAVLQPDDVIALINAKLAQEPGGTLLRQALQKRFPVCLVDECQDTDPEQFRLFNTLYNGQGQEGLYIIGDPKQSIYAFRGADIFSYLAVKQALPLEHIHTLDTNYRSTAGIMQGVNALFGEQESGTSFMYKGIDYAAIDSCENSDKKLHNKGQLIIANEPVTPFVFIGSKNYDTFNNMLLEFANDAAERIVSLLNQQAYIKKNGQKIPLHAGDITVLVREHKEALAIKKALAKRQLLSVYLSQKDSVLVQCAFAQDILFVKAHPSV
jgi:exodeoxyribonuclease V beta subunit